MRIREIAMARPRFVIFAFTCFFDAKAGVCARTAFTDCPVSKVSKSAFEYGGKSTWSYRWHYDEHAPVSTRLQQRWHPPFSGTDLARDQLLDGRKCRVLTMVDQ